MNLEQFLASRFTRNEFVSHPQFQELYVRKGNLIVFLPKPPSWTHPIRLERVLTLARIQAKTPGQGSFTRLVHQIRTVYQIPIFIECVLDDRFAKFLPTLGFQRIHIPGGDPDHGTASFLSDWEAHQVTQFAQMIAHPMILPVPVSSSRVEPES